MKILGLLSSVFVAVATQPIDRENRVGAFYYLLDYGYIAKDENTETAALMSDDVITKAIKDFQVSQFLIQWTMNDD